MKATHTERENWRDNNDKSENSEIWYSKFEDAEWFVVRFTAVVIIVFSVAYVVANSDILEIVRVINDFAANIITEAISIAITVLIIESFNRRRSERIQKEELILQMGSSDNGFAREAVRKLRHYKWLIDGSLQDANLITANLQGAYLVDANLQGTGLRMANLQEAKLWSVNLQGTRLGSANLQDAYLVNAQYIDTAHFDKDTTLPNGDKWHEGYDLAIFTDPEHPNFWEPEWVKVSPLFRA